jgi:hypothetical protein
MHSVKNEFLVKWDWLDIRIRAFSVRPIKNLHINAIFGVEQFDTVSC